MKPNHPNSIAGMDPNPKSHPLLSYVLSRLPSIGYRFAAPAASVDIEQPVDPPPSSSSGRIVDLDPNLLAAMSAAVNDVAQTRSVLKAIGERPDHESVDEARTKLAEIEANLAKKLEDVVLTPRPASVDRLEWRSHLAEKERACREEAEQEKSVYKAIISLDEMHEAYERMLKEAEDKLVTMIEKEMANAKEVQSKGKEVVEEVDEEVVEEVNEEVVGVLQEGLGTGVIDRVDLSGRRLRILPEAFGKIQSLVSINLASNQLEELPDSIAGLQNLEELNVSSNLLASLPDSIGLLHNLQILNVSGNKLTVLPDSICRCKSLVELDVSFNSLGYLPTNIGYEMPNLQRLSIQLNKIRWIPTSVCEMHSLKHLDAHFNELRGLPLAIGKLTNLETLNLASNFADLTELPETFGDLVSLRELDLSNNQIHALPDTFGRLDNLVNLNLEENPIVIPPVEVVKQGAEAVKEFMIKRWLDLLLEEEQRSLNEAKQATETRWVNRGVSWLTRTVSNASESLSGYLGSPRTPRDPFLDQQL